MEHSTAMNSREKTMRMVNKENFRCICIISSFEMEKCGSSWMTIKVNVLEDELSRLFLISLAFFDQALYFKTAVHPAPDGDVT
jgi:hypothetical protein